MSETTEISWADATFNPWIGCTKVSPACDHCYAEAYDKRWGGGHWGPKAPRRRTSPATWQAPRRLNKRSPHEFGHRTRVFCASLADVFDNKVPSLWRSDLWDLIGMTPNLDWLLLTKRPQNIKRMYTPPLGDLVPYRNVWLGTTVENQAEADRRIPELLAAPAQIRFLSCEPLLEAIDITPWIGAISWVIVGGESGAQSRMMQNDWALSLRYQCHRAGVPYFFKQMTKKAPIPAEMLVREFPVTA